jgi:hypothetical protein
MEVAGRTKMEQIRATGVRSVLLRQLQKQLRELMNYHKLQVRWSVCMT